MLISDKKLLWINMLQQSMKERINCDIYNTNFGKKRTMNKHVDSHTSYLLILAMVQPNFQKFLPTGLYTKTHWIKLSATCLSSHDLFLGCLFRRLPFLYVEYYYIQTVYVIIIYQLSMLLLHTDCLCYYYIQTIYVITTYRLSILLPHNVSTLL